MGEAGAHEPQSHAGAADHKHSINAWMHACFHGSMAMDRPVGWSRHNLVAYGAVHRGSACVAVVPSVHMGKDVADPLVTTLYPPPRAPPVLNSNALYELDTPSMVSFSPCGYTLTAFFPVSAVLTPCDAAETVPELPTSVVYPTQPADPPPLAANSPRAPVFSTASMGSPALTPLSFTPRAVPHASGAAMPNLESDPLGLSSPAPMLPYDHGVVCIWTRDPEAPISAWSLQQWIPVSSHQSFTNLSGFVIDMHWLDNLRMWKCSENEYTLTPSCGPSMAMPPAGLGLGEAASQQAFVLVSNVGQVVFVHRPQMGEPFRTHMGWLHVPGIYPSPATYEPTTLDKMFAPLDIRRISITALVDEPVLLVAYQSVSLGSAMHVQVSELTFDLHGDLSFFVVSPESPLSMRSPQDSLSGSEHKRLVPTAMAWSCLMDDSLVLLLALATDESAGDPLWSTQLPCDSSLCVWDFRRSQSRRIDELRCMFGHTPTSPSALDEGYKAWRITLRASLHMPGMVVSSLISESSPVPHARRMYATLLDMPNRGREVWAVIETDTFKWSCVDACVPEEALMRTMPVVSPCGVLACAQLRPTRRLGVLPLPVGAHGGASVGRLTALSLMRHTSPSDVVLYLCTQQALTPPVLMDTVRACAAALGYTRPALPLSQQAHLFPVVHALCECSADPLLRRHLFARTQVFDQLVKMHHTLCMARTDTTNARMSDLLLHGFGHDAFRADAVWDLAPVLRAYVGMLESMLATAVQCAAPGARAADIPASSFLELLVHANACRVAHEVLAGVCVFALWVERMPKEAWASMMQATTPTKCEAALHTLSSIQALVRDTLASSPLHLRRVLPFLEPASSSDSVFWDSWLHVPSAHTSSAAFERARRLLVIDDAVRDSLALVRRVLYPTDTLL